MNELNEFLEHHKLDDPRFIPNLGHIYLAKRTVDGKNQPIQINRFVIEEVARGNHDNYQYFLNNFFGMFLLRLDGSTRFNLTHPQPGGDLGTSPYNIFMSLFIDDESRLRIREIIFDALGKYFVIDPTSMLNLRI